MTDTPEDKAENIPESFVLRGFRVSEVSDEENPFCDNDLGDEKSKPHGETPGSQGFQIEDPFPSTEKRPCFRVYDEWVKHPDGGKSCPGVYWHSTKVVEKKDVPVDQWVCGPLYIEAQTCDANDNNYGRLLRFKTTLGSWREWAMPQELLAAGGAEMRGELLAMGLAIDLTDSKSTLIRYLQHKPPRAAIQCVLSVGWASRSAFVLPDVVIGPERDGFIFQSSEKLKKDYAAAGTLDGWREDVASLAIGNPIVMLGISAAFAGPLLDPAMQEAGGIHLVHKSSTGKTSVLDAARSVWGGEDFKRSWRGTANGLEAAAELHNDCLLPLDELSQCDAREVSQIIYMLGNGAGKSRATRTGSARSVRRWRLFVLSTGERTVEATLLEVGIRSKAGESVRMLDIQLERTYGVFDDLCGFEQPSALADGMNRATKRHFGYAGRAFLEKLTAHPECDFVSLHDGFKNTKLFQFKDLSGQEIRARDRFVLIGMAGELASEYGLTGWKEGEALQSAADGFKLWRDGRSGHGDKEPKQVMAALSGFIEQHADSRFSDITYTGHSPLVRNRAGYWELKDGKKTFYFTCAGMNEAINGFDLKFALRVLEGNKVIEAPGKDGKYAQSFAKSVFPALSKQTRLYVVDPDKLDGC